MLKVTRIDSLRKGGSLLQRSVERLEKGGLVAFPTECGYRWAVRADLEPAVVRLKRGLKRAENRPLGVASADFERVEKDITALEGRVAELGRAFWPGPLVMLLRRGPQLHTRDVGPEYLKVAVRVPYHPLAAEFLRLCPFAVLTGGTRLSAAQEVFNLYSARQGFSDLGQDLGEVLAWKEPCLRLEPTVVDLTQSVPRLVRVGFVGLNELRRFWPPPWLLSSEVGIPSTSLRGISEAHLVVVEGDPARVSRRLKTLLDSYARGQRVALVVTRETAELAFDPPPRHLVHYAAVSDSDELFESLHQAEHKARAGVILIEGFPRQGAGAVVMERLGQLAHEVINTEDPGYRGQAGMTSKSSQG